MPGERHLRPTCCRAMCTTLIRPCSGRLAFAKGKIPTPLGPIMIDWKASDSFLLSLTLPKGMGARVELPAKESSVGIFIRSNASEGNIDWCLQ
jgi:alpha-L-rhamnosidase